MFKKIERAKLEQEEHDLETQKPKPVTKEEKEIEKMLSLLNDHENDLENKIADLKSHLITIDNIKTKTSTLNAYVENHLTEIKVDLEKVGLSYEKIEFSITPDFLTALAKIGKGLSNKSTY